VAVAGRASLTDEELMARQGLYYYLASQQLEL
jgi:hypothetical protein